MSHEFAQPTNDQDVPEIEVDLNRPLPEIEVELESPEEKEQRAKRKYR